MRGGSSNAYPGGRSLPGFVKATGLAVGLAGAFAVAVPAAPPAALAAGARAKIAKGDRVVIPAGPFIRGSTRVIDERPVETKRLRRFAIDRTEVTRAMYARCVAARRCKPVALDLAAEPELPVTGVSWHDARGYCSFAGGRLPTEDEWEKAARGSDGREFPWGPGADCTRANWGNFEGEGPCAGKNPGRPTPVGTYSAGASPFGVMDLGGNVWEWVDGAYEDEPGRKVVRGGSCCSYFVEPRAANRNAWAPEHRDGDLGFRCASN
jgi:formylglycine-generating enzyme required for sulfatase activity